MADDDLVFPLYPDQFGPAERPLLSAPGFEVSAFAYRSGVAALRVRTARVEAVLLPFRGQQVWRYAVDGRELAMRTHFDEPAASTVFGETYGPFMLHCGLTGIGAPSPADTHAHHGELPNARYEEAALVLRGGRLTVTGTTRLRTSHSLSARFRPSVTMHADTTALRFDMAVTNDRSTPLRYSYLCHVNWAPVDGAELVHPVPYLADTFVVDPHPAQTPETAAYTARIAADPAASERIDLAQPLVPEYCAVLTPNADADGWAEFLMVRPDGSAASVRQDTSRLPLAIRWISNTGDEQAAGFCLPSTARHHGRAAAEADGLLVDLAPGETHELCVVAEVVDADEAARRRAAIASYSQ